ncbi:hydroxyisourate hydrolase [Burkholderia stabilis]|uniref:hydroxyisourate hydrolase n=1 Tax=Burkholderia stabilis TaxID=95485 RepID=UPI001F4A7735|nr:hydroxyisourate hydrolase [Burkholderia stabilis]
MSDRIDARRRRLMLATATVGGVIAGLPVWAAAATEQAADADPAQPSLPARRRAPAKLTIHVVDILRGAPAAGLRVDLARLDGESRISLGTATVGRHGSTDEPLLAGADYRAGMYEALLHVDAYYRARTPKPAGPSFLTTVPVRFRITNAQERLHLPVQFGPWSYTCYRGS